MSTVNDAARSSVARTRRYRARQRQGARCIRVEVSDGDVAALVDRGYLAEDASRDSAAIKAAIEGLIADVAFELETERSTRNELRKRVTARHDDA